MLTVNNNEIAFLFLWRLSDIVMFFPLEVSNWCGSWCESWCGSCDDYDVCILSCEVIHSLTNIIVRLWPHCARSITISPVSALLLKAVVEFQIYELRVLALSSLTQLVIVYPETVEQPASATSYRLPSAARRLCLQSANLLIDNLGWR
jgi:hypothetical protein